MVSFLSVHQSPEKQAGKASTKRTEQSETKLSETFLSSLLAFCSLARNSYFLVPKKMFHMPTGGATRCLWEDSEAMDPKNPRRRTKWSDQLTQCSNKVGGQTTTETFVILRPGSILWTSTCPLEPAPFPQPTTFIVRVALNAPSFCALYVFCISVSWYFCIFFFFFVFWCRCTLKNLRLDVVPLLIYNDAPKKVH